MRKTKRILWGVIFVVIGVMIALDALKVLPFELLFDGWWTLFIILPCTVSLVTEKHKTGSIVGILIGVALLLASQNVIGFDLLWKLAIPAIIVLIGLKMIFGSARKRKTAERVERLRVNTAGDRSATATFGGADLVVDGEVFEGAELTAVFGGVQCDLRNAIIEKDCVITVSAIFGGIDILVSDKINIETDVTCIFGGVADKTRSKKDAPTLYISGNCLFGGVDIK